MEARNGKTPASARSLKEFHPPPQTEAEGRKGHFLYKMERGEKLSSTRVRS